MNTSERDSFYAARTGLSRTAIVRFRRTPVGEWTTTADRRIGSSVRGLERMADNPEIPWAEWRRAAHDILATIRDFVRGVFDTAVSFAERLGSVIERVLLRLREVLEVAGPIVLGLAAIFGVRVLDALERG